MTSFWLLSDPDRAGSSAEVDDRTVYAGPIRCPVNPGHQRAGPRVTDLTVILPPRRRDFVWTWHGDCLIEDHVLRLLRVHDVTGFDVRPVHARGADDPLSGVEPNVPTYWELVVTGWGGIAPAASGVELHPAKSCSACGHLRYSGLKDVSKLLDVGQWDGSDVFMIWPYPRFRVVTDKVAELIRAHELTGVVLRTLAELAEDEILSRGASPGRLSYWMPEARARLLGGSLGID